MWGCWRSDDLFFFFLEINLTSGYITEIFSRRSGDIQIENFMRPSARLLICTMSPPEAHEFDTPALHNREIIFPCNSSNERLTVCKIVGCFYCGQVHFPSTPMPEHGKRDVAKNLRDFERNITAMRNLYNVFFDRFDVGNKHWLCQKTLTFYDSSHQYQLGEAGATA